MKKLLFLFIISVCSVLSGKDIQLSDYIVKNRYKTAVPCTWARKEIDFGYKHILLLKKDRLTEIKITSYPSDYLEKEKWDNWKAWYFSGLGYRINIIAEESSEKIKGSTARLTLFDYISGGVKFLQRTMIIENPGGLIVIECKSPVSEFNRYNEIFNVVMGRLELSKN